MISFSPPFSHTGKQDAMPATSFDAERTYDDEFFSTHSLFESERMKAVLDYFVPRPFIPVHGPDSDVTIAIGSRTAVVREGTDEHAVAPGNVVVVKAGIRRGLKAGDTRLEALLVTASSPTDKEHVPVRKGFAAANFSRKHDEATMILLHPSRRALGRATPSSSIVGGQ